MGEVHVAISAHSKQQHAVVTQFAQLDAMREAAIEAAVALCLQGQPFSVDGINGATQQVNELAAKYGYVPTRKYVTADMVQEYAARLQKK
ncbi:YpbS family protein [Ectobacillus ponti]|uniref:YpbS family protein n=1 Tax=Ectobacillus ponti TaxID=2961894 RepID=A0AA41X9K8_9BACI|nr:YpbS family protein [Ectobacillus ponti]MCP8968813.1 YpbS family protein [Ectobacillus ponti]